MVKKHVIDTSESLWKRVLMYKLEKDFKDVNSAVLSLLEIGLKYAKGAKNA
jgi:hypothetical protein